MRIATKHTPKKSLFPWIFTGLVVLSVIGYFSYAYISKSVWPFTATETTPSEKGVNEINYDPATEEEINNSQDGKKNSLNEVENDSATSLNKVRVGVSFADKEGENFEVRAFVTSVIEGTGTCTVSLTKGDKTVQGTSQAFVDASSSQCRPIYIPLSSISPAGDWIMTVMYKSPTSEGSSQSEVVKI